MIEDTLAYFHEEMVDMIIMFEDTITKLGFHIEFVTRVSKYPEQGKYTLIKEYYIFKKTLWSKKLLDCDILLFKNYKFDSLEDMRSLVEKLNNIRRRINGANL